ncbi:AmmeMemoRadiSam system protein B [Candidatus Omnitrophota bacterium]
MIRQAVVAGQFYPSEKDQLFNQIKQFNVKDVKKQAVKGLVMPHAGYMYSGSVAAEVIAAADVDRTSTFVIIGPNHTGQGQPFSIMTEGAWQTPCGMVNIDTSLAKKILDSSRHLADDYQAHQFEHSIEVQLPFLQFYKKEFTIIPITVSTGTLETYQTIAHSIAQSVKECQRENDTIIIASSDMTHYETQEEAESKDRQATEAMLNLDETELFNRVHKYKISMCGYASVVIMLSACKELGARSARLVKYETSGEVTGDFSAVVGYAGLTIY